MGSNNEITQVEYVHVNVCKYVVGVCMHALYIKEHNTVEETCRLLSLLSKPGDEASNTKMYITQTHKYNNSNNKSGVSVWCYGTLLVLIRGEKQRGEGEM